MTDVLAFMESHIFETISLIGVMAALLISARQISLTSQAIRAQSFANLLGLEIQSKFQEGMLAIASLSNYSHYDDFLGGEDKETQAAIYNTVLFLNHMAVLGEEEYLHIQDAWDVYFWSYRICFEKLLPWWLDGQRTKQPNLFPSFERACMVTNAVSSELIKGFDKQIGAKHLDKYHKTSRIPRERLQKVLATQFSRIAPDNVRPM